MAKLIALYAKPAMYPPVKVRQIGYAYNTAAADQIIAAYRSYGGVEQIYRMATNYDVPKIWKDTYLPVYYQNGPTEWGRFFAPWNKITVSCLGKYFYTWSKNNGWAYVATTRDVGDLTYAANNRDTYTWVCQGMGKKPSFDSQGNFLECR